MSNKSLKNAKKALFVAQKGLCCYCQRKLSLLSSRKNERNPPNMATIEHLRRKTDGGTSRRDNLALACAPCNNGRGDTDWLTYKSYKMGEI